EAFRAVGCTRAPIRRAAAPKTGRRGRRARAKDPPSRRDQQTVSLAAMAPRLPIRREPRTLLLNRDAARASVEAAITPELRAWKATTPDLAAALDLARAKWLDHANIETTPLAEAIISLAVTWLKLDPSWTLIGAGATDTIYRNMEPLVDFWVAERGLAFAIDALAAPMSIAQE